MKALVSLLLVLLIALGCQGGRRLASRSRALGPGSHADHVSGPSLGGRGTAVRPLETPTASLTKGRSRRRSLVVDGVERTYKVYLPVGYTSDRPFPLVVVLHGGGGSGEQIESVSGLSQKADTAGFIVVYPDGSGRRFLTWNAGDCCGYAVRQNVDDVAFINAVLDEVERDFFIDRRRVFVAGMSNGGMLAYRLACELSDRIAAIAVVSATMAVTTCNPTRAVSVLHIHGTSDDNIPFGGGVGARSLTKGDYRPVLSTVREWVRLDRTEEIPQVTYRKGRVTCETYDRGREGTIVSLCRVEGGGHVWPGGSKDENPAFSANDVIWRFFSAHARQ